MTTKQHNKLYKEVTATYSVFIGNATIDNEFEGLVYKVINTNTGLTELETTRLPQALSAAKEMDEWLLAVESGEAFAGPDEIDFSVMN